MLAFIALFFPAAIMVVWKRHLFKEENDWKAMLIEYIAGVLLINFLVIAVAYLFFGSQGSVVGNINAYINFAIKYILLAMVLAVGIPWGWKWIKAAYFKAGKNEDVLNEQNSLDTTEDTTDNEGFANLTVEGKDLPEQKEKVRFRKIRNNRIVSGAIALFRTLRSFLGKFVSRKFVVYFLVAAAIVLVVFAVYYDDYTDVSSETIAANDNLGRMTLGNVYSQEFVCEYDGLESIELYLATYEGTNSGTLSITLSSASSVIDEWVVECVKLADNTYYTLMLDSAQKESAGVTYTIEIVPDADEEDAVTAYINTSGDYDGLSINGEEQDGQSICYLLNYTNAFPSNGAGKYILRYCFLAALIFAAWIFIQSRKLAIEKVFLIFWVLISGLFICSNTLFNVPDEYGHFYRAYEISQGELISIFNEEENAGGSVLPLKDLDLSVLQNSWQSFDYNKESLTLSEDTFIGFSNQALMSPVSYLPQAIGIFIARHITNNIAAIAYSGRLAAWLFVTILFYLAIKILPKGKEFLCMIALLPMNVHEAVSLSPDTAVVALSTLMIAMVMYLRYVQDRPLRRPQIVALYALAIAVSLTKIVYIVFCLIYLLIPHERFKRGKKGKITHAAILVLLASGLNLGWLYAVGNFLTHKGSDSSRQIAYVLQYPFRYFLAVIRTFMLNGFILVQQMMGTSLAWLSVSTVALITMLCAVCLIIITKRDRNAIRSDQKILFERLVYAAIILCVIVLTATSLYVQWTLVYTDSISGLQGRYFIALLLPLYLFAVVKTRPDNAAKKEKMGMLTQLTVVTSNLCACISLLFACLA